MNLSKILGGKKCNEEGYYCTNKKTPLGKRGCKSSNTGAKSKLCECLPMGNTYRCGLSIKNKKSQNYKIIELEKENKILKHKLNETKKIIQRLLSERKKHSTPKRQISDDFLSAYRSKNMQKKNFLGVIKGEIKLLEGRGISINDIEVLKVLKKFEKGIKENIERGHEPSKIELEWISEYLPKMMKPEKIEAIIKDLIKNGSDNIGKIMGTFNKEYRGKADNKEVSFIAKKLLDNG